MANTLAQYLADLQVQIKEAESQLVFGVVISTSPLRVKYGEITLEDNFLFVEDGVTLTVGQEVPMLKTNRSQLFIVMLSKEFIPQEITPQEILSKIKTVDGSGSGLDADLLDGKHASDFSLDGHTQAWETLTGVPTTATRWPTWPEVTSKPSTFPPSSHTHTDFPQAIKLTGGVEAPMTGNLDTAYAAGLYSYASTTTGRPSSYGAVQTIVGNGAVHNNSNNWLFQLGFSTDGGMYLRRKINSGAFTSWTLVGGSVIWDDVSGKPAQATRWPSWAEVSGKPSTFAPSSHTHAYANYSGRVVTNYNSYMTSGMYGESAVASNSPGGSYKALIVAHNADVGLQITGGYNIDKLWFRGWWSSGAGWSSWRELWHSGNSYGSNSASGYIRLGNGFKLNWVQVTIPASTRGKTFTWPSAFTSAVYATWASSKYYDVHGAVDGASTTGGAVNAGALSNGGTVGIAITWTVYGIGV